MSSLRGRFFHNKVRQNPPIFGVMRVGVSVERPRSVITQSQGLKIPV
jgi:hypothetical protein